MSHFTVTVRIPDASINSGVDLKVAVTEMLAPYQENNMGEKWDWWVIGGRWSNTLAIKEGTTYFGLQVPPKGDLCRIQDLDRDAMALEGREDLDEAWTRWVSYRASLLEGPDLLGMDEYTARNSAFRLGLVECLSSDEATPERIKGRPSKQWTNPNTKIVMVDVINDITEEDFKRKFVGHFYPCRTFAYLDANGWNEPGEMGWWGVSSATPESTLEHADGFLNWLKSGDQTDWMVIVDCHI